MNHCHNQFTSPCTTCFTDTTGRRCAIQLITRKAGARHMSNHRRRQTGKTPLYTDESSASNLGKSHTRIYQRVSCKTFKSLIASRSRWFESFSSWASDRS
ncbi:hypothetical protein Mapa_007500 [Marchantia paleacea]|nr:hypothetical protein Mapa_007500 [Marchantia paleacea]